MDSKLRVFLLALLGVALTLAGSISGGSMEAGGLAGTGTYAAARQLLIAPATSSMLGLEARRRILGSIRASSLDPNRPACLKSCPAAGGPYTGGRGCLNAYQCRG